MPLAFAAATVASTALACGPMMGGSSPASAPGQGGGMSGAGQAGGDGGGAPAGGSGPDRGANNAAGDSMRGAADGAARGGLGDDGGGGPRRSSYAPAEGGGAISAAISATAAAEAQSDDQIDRDIAEQERAARTPPVPSRAQEEAWQAELEAARVRVEQQAAKAKEDEELLREIEPTAAESAEYAAKAAAQAAQAAKADEMRRNFPPTTFMNSDDETPEWKAYWNRPWYVRALDLSPEPLQYTPDDIWHPRLPSGTASVRG